MARPTLRGRAGLLASLALALFVGCGDREAPVGGLAVTPSTIDFAYPEAVEVEFAWTPTAALSEGGGRLRVFVHLVDSAGELIRTFDHGFPESWEPSSPVTYTVPLYQSAIGPALPPGSYGLEVGLYDESGKRWRLEAAEEQSNRAYRVAEVVVSDGAGALPTFTFSPGWLPEELGKDKQILVRRWLSEAGSVYASGVSEPGRLWIRLATPTGAVENHTLVLAEGESQPGVVVTGCDGRVERLAADEVRELTYEVAADCEISLSPNYYWQESETDVRRSLALEGVAWIR